MVARYLEEEGLKHAIVSVVKYQNVNAKTRWSLKIGIQEPSEAMIA